MHVCAYDSVVEYSRKSTDPHIYLNTCSIVNAGRIDWVGDEGTKLVYLD
jgi:hypothetical protein